MALFRKIRLIAILPGSGLEPGEFTERSGEIGRISAPNRIIRENGDIPLKRAEVFAGLKLAIGGHRAPTGPILAARKESARFEGI